MRTRWTAALGAAVLVVACGGDADQNPTTTQNPTNGSGVTQEQPANGVQFTEVAHLDAPLALVARPGTENLFVAEQSGTVRMLTPRNGGFAASDPVLDISSDVKAGGEQGLLGLAFAADGATAYVDYTDNAGDTNIVAFPVATNGTFDGSGGTLLLKIDQPFANHNGGNLVIGPDGFLYIGMGDGGSQGDPSGNGQNPNALLASVLRIDPTKASDGRPYAIPPGNPYRDGSGADEVWLKGVRNPWRFSFDSETGDLWLADVGNQQREEVDHLEADADGLNAGLGANLGWGKTEGTVGTNPDGAVLPVYEYAHDDGCAIIGGLVVRSETVPVLTGRYLFADQCVSEVRAIAADSTPSKPEVTRYPTQFGQIVSFGTDRDGEVYVVSLAGGIFRIDPAA